MLFRTEIPGNQFADLFKQQIEDERISHLLDLINAKTPTGVILFEIAKERDTRKVTERIAELMYTVLLRELDYAEDFDIAELEIELESEDKLNKFVQTCKELHGTGLVQGPQRRSEALACQRRAPRA